MRKIYILLRDSITGWLQNEAVLHSAALAYFTIFSLAPLAIISISIASLVFNQAAVQGVIVEMLEPFVGVEAATLMQDIVLNTSNPNSNRLAAGIGAVVMLYGASIVFVRLQKALDAMWNIVPATEDVRQNAMAFVVTGLLSAAAALTVGVYLLALMLLNAAWASLPKTLFAHFDVLAAIINFAVTPVLYIIPFALIYKWLPKAVVRWRAVWVGAALTAVLFWIGGNIIGLYLTYSGFTSIYGAAGSLVAVLLWVFYSAMVFLFGAKFTQVYAKQTGTPIEPVDGFQFDTTANDLKFNPSKISE